MKLWWKGTNLSTNKSTTILKLKIDRTTTSSFHYTCPLVVANHVNWNERINHSNDQFKWRQIVHSSFLWGVLMNNTSLASTSWGHQRSRITISSFLYLGVACQSWVVSTKKYFYASVTCFIGDSESCDEFRKLLLGTTTEWTDSCSSPKSCLCYPTLATGY